MTLHRDSGQLRCPGASPRESRRDSAALRFLQRLGSRLAVAGVVLVAACGGEAGEPSAEIEASALEISDDDHGESDRPASPSASSGTRAPTTTAAPAAPATAPTARQTTTTAEQAPATVRLTTTTVRLTTTTVAVTTTAGTAERLMAALTVAEERPRAGYDRALFQHWIDADRDFCDTRREVLIAESLTEATIAGRCRIISGEWWSLYDGERTSDPSGFDVDHMVPLAEAWDSGADTWDSARRRAFANDLDRDYALIAVSDSSNRRKGDRDPAEWKPQNRDSWCAYAWAWASVKVAWGLCADQAEAEALAGMLEGCDPAEFEAMPTAEPLPPATTTQAPSTTAPPATTTPATTAAPATTAGSAPPPNPGDARNCSDFATHAEAQAWFDVYFPHYGDVARLDRNSDGRVCESLP